jgi:hypothetical protein
LADAGGTADPTGIVIYDQRWVGVPGTVRDDLDLALHVFILEEIEQCEKVRPGFAISPEQMLQLDFLFDLDGALF